MGWEKRTHVWIILHDLTPRYKQLITESTNRFGEYFSSSPYIIAEPVKVISAKIIINNIFQKVENP